MSSKSALDLPAMTGSAATPPAELLTGPPRRPRFRSLATRLTAWYAISSFAIVLIATVLLYFALTANFDNVADQFLVSKVHTLRGLLHDQKHYEFAVQEEVEETWAPRQYSQVFGRVIDENGNTKYESPNMSKLIIDRESFPPPLPATKDPAQGINVTAKDGRPLRITSAYAILGPGDHPAWTLQLALDRNSQTQMLSVYRQRLWIVLGAAIVACSFMGYRIARGGIRPLHDIARDIGDVKSTTLHKRIEIAGLPSELSVLADTFNVVLDRLEESFDRLSRFSADIAHELRTPVHNLRGTSEVVLAKARTNDEYREALGSCLEETERLSRIIDSLLFLARAENPRMQIQRDRMRVARELSTLREYFEAAASDRGVTLNVDCNEALDADVDRTLFQRAVSNLISNALAHSSSGGTIIMAARTEGASLRVDVIDNGTGIAPEHLPRLFDRLYRADPSRSFTGGNIGLGLSIVRGIAQLHGGKVGIESEKGKGTCVTIWFGATGG